MPVNRVKRSCERLKFSETPCERPCVSSRFPESESLAFEDFVI